MAWRRSVWQVVADWWSFQITTVRLWLFPRPDTDDDHRIRQEGERLRRRFPEHYRHERSRRAHAEHLRRVLSSRAAYDR